VKVSAFDIVLVSVFLAVALIGGYFKILGPEMVAAIVTGCLAFLAMRVKARGTSETTIKTTETKETTRTTHVAEDGAPDKQVEGHHSVKLLLNGNGSVKSVEIDDIPDRTDDAKVVEEPDAKVDAKVDAKP